MPLDKARIQGIGSDGPAPPKPPECPGGHELQLWAARSGKCDGCHKKVQTGELVMDCRRCNWYLCNICCPQNKSQESSVWGALSSLPFYVLDDMAEMASDIETFVSASVFDQDKDADGQGKAGSQDTPVSPRQKAESIQMVSQFCEKYPAVRVVPNEVDLDVFWTRCSVLQPKPVADAIYEQLSFSGGDIEWQPRLRALYALEHLHQKGGTGKDISKMVMHSAKELLQHLVDVPQCSQKAQHVIAVLKGAKPPEAPAPKAQAGSSAGPAAAEPKSAASSAPAASSSSPAKPKAAAQKPTDLLDLAPASVPPPPKVVGGTPADLLDLQMPASGSTGPRGQGVGDLLDLAAHPGLAAAAPLVTPAPAPAPAPTPAERLADLYALYPKSNNVPPPPPVVPKHAAAFGLLPPPGQMPVTEAPAPSVARPSPEEASAATNSKDGGLESLMSDAVAGLSNLGASPAPSQPSRQPAGMHRALAAH